MNTKPELDDLIEKAYLAVNGLSKALMEANDIRRYTVNQAWHILNDLMPTERKNASRTHRDGPGLP